MGVHDAIAQIDLVSSGKGHRRSEQQNGDDQKR